MRSVSLPPVPLLPEVRVPTGRRAMLFALRQRRLVPVLPGTRRRRERGDRVLTIDQAARRFQLDPGELASRWVNAAGDYVDAAALDQLAASQPAPRGTFALTPGVQWWQHPALRLRITPQLDNSTGGVAAYSIEVLRSFPWGWGKYGAIARVYVGNGRTARQARRLAIELAHEPELLDRPDVEDDWTICDCRGAVPRLGAPVRAAVSRVRKVVSK